ncbi:G-protein alpha subunit-domain-containing protein [Aspergillus lucknowensis]|uniref:G-protein alpha subunit-domain-containing protein n=1 Tax=Aspergillus lucknowensis TaxID=176173 RepID=A0ABR4LV78_9EURO
MADPITIIGTAGALANIIQLSTQIIAAIREIQGDWKDADLAFLSLTSQLTSLRLALTKIEEWMAHETGAHYQLVMDMDDSIKCCKILLTKLQELVGGLRQKQDKALNFQSRIKLVLGKKSFDDIQSLLMHQTDALNLLLTACNCKTSAEQKALLERSSSQKILRQTNLDSASLMVQYDTDSFASRLTDTLSRLSLKFSFDRDLFTSDVYGRFFRELTKRHPDGSQTRVPAAERETVVDDEPEQPERSVLFIGSEYSGIDATLQKVVGVLPDHPTGIHHKLQRMVVYRFVILSMKAVVAAFDIGNIGFWSYINTAHATFLRQYAEDIDPTKSLDARVGKALRSLWHDRCMDRVRQSPQDFGLTDSALRLLDEFDRISSPGYIPTPEDMQTVKYRTPAFVEVYVKSRIIEHQNEEGNSPVVTHCVKMRDVTLRFGSNRPYNFEALTAIFLPVNLDDYNNVIAKEPFQTALLHCTSKLKATLQSAWFPKNRMIVVILSQPGEFDTKLAAYPFADYYPGYMGTNESAMIQNTVLNELLALHPKLLSLAVVDPVSPKRPYLATLINISENFPRIRTEALALYQGQEERIEVPPSRLTEYVSLDYMYSVTIMNSGGSLSLAKVRFSRL